MLKASVFGGTGYTGIELIRMLAHHPGCELNIVTSEQHAGNTLHEVLPFFAKFSRNIPLVKKDEGIGADMDVAFLALPHTVSMKAVEELRKRDVHVIDLSADFRLMDGKTYEETYGVRHTCPDLLDEAVYGVCELKREKIRSASLVAVPGCFPMSVIIPVYPLLKEGLVEEEKIIADCKTGVSGGGRSPSLGFHYPEVEGGMRAYGFPVHRHTSEINLHLSEGAGKDVKITFIPHLAPMVRGILATLYLVLREGVGEKDIREAYASYYAEEPYVRMYPPLEFPSTRYVFGSNYCDIGFAVRRDTGLAVVVCAIDNLMKGASGAAIQCMNVMFGFDETASIGGHVLFP